MLVSQASRLDRALALVSTQKKSLKMLKAQNEELKKRLETVKASEKKSEMVCSRAREYVSFGRNRPRCVRCVIGSCVEHVFARIFSQNVLFLLLLLWAPCPSCVRACFLFSECVHNPTRARTRVLAGGVFGPARPP